MGVSATSKETSQRRVYRERNVTKQSRIVVFTSILLKLHLFVLPLVLALTVPSLLSSYVNIIASFLSRLFNGCNLSPNHVFLVLNSIIAAIAATSKISRAAQVQTVTANTPETEVQKTGGSEQDSAQQISMRPTEHNSDICALESTTREAFPEDAGIEEQERQVISNCQHDPEDESTRVTSPLRDSNATDDELKRSINPTEPEVPLPRQATEGDSIEDIWRSITDKRQCHFSNFQVHESRSRVNKQAAPTLSSLTRFSRCEDAVREVPELNAKSLGREPSKGLEELNRKSEEFIARFSEQMRLQREESMIRYMRMVDTGICR